MRIFAAAAATLLASAPLVTSEANLKSFVKNLLKDETKARRLEARNVVNKSTSSTAGGVHPTFLNQHRRFGKANREEVNNDYNNDSASSLLGSAQKDGLNQETCDSAFSTCISDKQCVSCFGSLESNGVDWATVHSDTPCATVLEFLYSGEFCTDLIGNQRSTDLFCNTFNSCVTWGEAEKDDKETIDCDALETCDWKGIHISFIGDGTCNDALSGCYNHAICGYDGGDCCEKSCDHLTDTKYHKCGQEGYTCRDPHYQTESSSSEDDIFQCKLDETPYRIIMYDSFGDGWDSTKLTLKHGSTVLFNGGLEEGSKGTERICLADVLECYQIDVSGGSWGIEVSWEMKPMRKGAPAIASGGAPMECEFGVASARCENTCDGKRQQPPDNDPEYKSYKEMYNCFTEKCIIQMGSCVADEACVPCLEEDSPNYCFANENFLSLIDCGLCHCLDEEAKGESEFCMEKNGSGNYDDDLIVNTDDFGQSQICSSSQTLRGSSAILAFSNCTDMGQIGMMITDFDEDNFGAIDSFEECAHAYNNNNNRRSALGCLKVLYNAIDNPTSPTDRPDAPADAISSVARSLYHNAEAFCDCSKNALENCPVCESFFHFKTLLYEILDACHALDEIDCDAWDEFSTPCKSNIVQMYGSVDFSQTQQCEYAQNGCGGAGPFPAFRKLDCGREIPRAAWDFYGQYDSGCINSSGTGAPSHPPGPANPPRTPIPNPSPAPKPNPSPAPSPKPYIPSGGGKPYTPSTPDDNGNTEPKKKNRHVFLTLLFWVGVGGGGFYIYKKRSGSFDFVRYRRAGAYDTGNDMYSSLSLDTNSSSFEPPTLPPTPMQTMT